MAVARRVRRLVNPRPRKRKRNAAANHRRRRLTPAQIRAGFGGKRARSAHKARRKVRAKANPKTRIVYRTKTKYRTRVKVVHAPRRKANRRHKRRKSNPALLVTYGPAMAANPRKRSKTVAKRRKRNSSRRHHVAKHRRRAANPVKVVYRYKTRSRRRHSNPRRRRNPVAFGMGHSPMDMVKAVGGGLIGVTVTKMVPSMLPSLTASPVMKAVVSAATAYGAGYLAGKMDRKLGDAVMFGGFMQAGSVLLNAFLPSVGGVIGLSGIRGLTPSNDILLPYNPFGGRGAMASAGSPGSLAAPGGGFTQPFA